ncbi:MAG TPA: hypothetical protein VEQ65_02690, partial [Opitutus sp.]|nr:hypothetical protein [Opitutus sp.]
MNTPLRLVSCLLIIGLLVSGNTWALETNSRLVNLSTRAVVGAGSDVLIAGFVIRGPGPKDVLIRALGPNIAASVPGALTQLRLQLFDEKGRAVVGNERWASLLKADFTKVGAGLLSDSSGDAALRVTLAPGNYTAQVNGVSSTKGVALVEVYEMDGTSRLINLSTRARVETGDGIMISGLVITGTGSRRVLVRALGPNLADVGVTGTLSDPVISVINSSGAVVAGNDNWSDGSSIAMMSATSAAAGAGPLRPGSKDAAIITQLPSGAYTIHVKGNGSASGVALLEVYDITDTMVGVPASGPFTPHTAAALSWDRGEVSGRLGPTFEQLNPGAPDDRPTLFKAESKMPTPKYYLRIKPYELGEPGLDNADY